MKKETLPQPPAPPSGKKWVEYKEGPERKEWISWNGRNWHWNCPGTNALMAVEDTAAPVRYFRHVRKFGDDTDYVELDGDVATAVSREGHRHEMLSRSKDVMANVAHGLWVEIPDPTSQNTALNSLEKLEETNKRLREELATIRDDWNKDHMEMKRKYDTLQDQYVRMTTARDAWMKDATVAIQRAAELEGELAAEKQDHNHTRQIGLSLGRASIDGLTKASSDIHRASMEITNLNEIILAQEKDTGYFMGLLEHVAVLVGGEAFEDGRVVHAFVPDAVAKLCLKLKEFENDCFQDTDPQTCCGNDH